MRLHEITETDEIPKPKISTTVNPASPKPGAPRTAEKPSAEPEQFTKKSKPKKPIKPEGPQPPKPETNRVLPAQAYLLP